MTATDKTAAKRQGAAASPPADDETIQTPPADTATAPAAPENTSETAGALETAEATAGDDSAAKKWQSVLIVADGDVPPNARRAVIVIQSSKRADPASSPKGEPDFGTHRKPTQAPVVETAYPKGADVYFAVDPVDFGEGREPVVGVGMGRGVVQAGFPGFAERLGQVHVGPSHPAFAAANYAYTRGARKIEIVGLSPEEVEVLRPWFGEVADKAEIVYGG